MAEPDPSLLAAGDRLFERPWQLLKSAPDLEFLPPADRAEVAFAGRSNVGKSSLINALVRQGGLARTSNTPGRTQELNFFRADAVPLYLVDMPHNLEAPHRLGMTTVLVHSDYIDHPAQLQMRNWRALPDHIHFATDCLTSFLNSLRPRPSG